MKPRCPICKTSERVDYWQQLESHYCTGCDCRLSEPKVFGKGKNEYYTKFCPPTFTSHTHVQATKNFRTPKLTNTAQKYKQWLENPQNPEPCASAPNGTKTIFAQTAPKKPTNKQQNEKPN